MNRYTNVSKFTQEVTNNAALKTYFTLLLMSQNTEQKQAIEQDFWKAVEKLDAENRESLMTDYRQTLPQLLQISRNLRAEAKDLVRLSMSKAA